MLKLFLAETTLLDEASVFEMWLEKVNEQRREKVLRCKQMKDKQRSLLAGVILRQALEAEGFSYEEMEFFVTSEGKPMILSNPQVHFNMSHAGDWVCCLISDAPIGIDLECFDKAIFKAEKENRLSAMAKKCLSNAEWQMFEQSPQQKKCFLEYWTRKEAYSKFVRKGLGMDFSKIDTETDKAQYWTKWITDNYCVSIYNEIGNYEDLFVKQITSL